MHPDNVQALQDFETRLRSLMLQFRRLRAEKVALTQELSQMRNEVDTLKTQNFDLKRQLSALRMAHLITMEESDVKTARNKINRMIREVDKCIAMLGA